MKKTLLLLALVILWSNTINAQNTVFLSSTEMGRGILRERSGEIFVITPKHVVKESTSSITVTGEKNIVSQATLVQMYSDDLAILRIDGGGKQKCTDWEVAQDFDNVLKRSSSGFIEYRDLDGSVKFSEVNIAGIDNENITISSKNSAIPIAKGWSGSSLFTNNGTNKVFLGLLTEIDRGKGNVLRADYMMRIMTGFFGESEVEESTESQNKSINGALDELMTKQIRMKVTKFEQVNNKVTFYFTLQNSNPSVRVINYNTHVNNHKLIDQLGHEFHATEIKYGSNADHVDLVYNVPAYCHVVFEVGANSITKAALLELNGYNYEFKFYDIPLVKTQAVKKEAEKKPTGIALSDKRTSQQILLTVKRFEQVNNKAIFYFSLENQNPAKQIIEYGTHISNHRLIDQNGLAYKATDIEYGNTNDRVDLIYNNPVNCQVEFEVGAAKITKAALLELNGYNHKYQFTNINLSSENPKPTGSSTTPKVVTDPKNALGSMEEKGVKISVNRFEQIGNKAIIYYSLENTDAQHQTLEVGTHTNNASLQCDNYTFQCTALELGNTGTSTNLIYRYPVNCYAEFEVGSVKISRINQLKLSLYNHEFEFVGKGTLGTPNSLKSSKAIQERNKLIGTGVNTVLDLMNNKN